MTTYRLRNNSAMIDQRRMLRQKQPDAERKLWSILKGKQMSGFKFFRQYSIGSYILDFYSPTLRLAIEADGGQHAEILQQQHDNMRTKFLQDNHIKVIRFWNNEILQNLGGVWSKIKEVVDDMRASASYPLLPPLILRGGNPLSHAGERAG